MGFLESAIDSVERFQTELLPVGYERRWIKWVFDVDIEKDSIQRNTNAHKSIEMTRPAPKAPGDRTSGKVSPTLLVDDASYVLGIPNPEKKNSNASEEEHKEFVRLHKIASRYTRSPDLAKALDILETISDEQQTGIGPKDATAIRLGGDTWLFDEPEFKRFWSRYLEKRLVMGKAACALCGKFKPALRILPFRIRLFGQNVPIISINTKEQPAFGSQGKDQLANATICYSCVANANQVLQYLVDLDKDTNGKSKSSGRHAVVISHDSSRGKGRQPLNNQIAVFWTKELLELQTKKQEVKKFEDIAKVPIEEFDNIPENAPPAKADQCRYLLEAPFIGGKSNVTTLPANRFYLAVLSPNKTRLVVREWLETDIEPVRKNIKNYINALQIIHPDGRGIWWTPLPAILEALSSYTSVRQAAKEIPRLPLLGPDAIRKLIRCIYTGTPPPDILLTRAVRCFRVPDLPTDDWNQRDRQMMRRMALAAVMKLVLTYGKNKEEQKAMEQKKTEYDAKSDYKQLAPYNCGILLAILEAIQRRASSSGHGVNATLVDRYYGAASASPGTVFANLVSMATKAHLPKLRRENKELFKVRYQEESVNINEMMAEACDAINNAGGFPPPLSPEEQAQFALGFYHQRAELSPSFFNKRTNNSLKNILDIKGG